MSVRRSRPAIAGERIPHGSPVRIVDETAFIERDLARADGITRRVNAANHVEEGEPADVLVDGGLLAELEPGRIAWAEICKGRIAHAR